MKRGYRYYLADTQAHYSPGDPELVEGGKLWIIGAPRNVRQAPPRGTIEDANSVKDRVRFSDRKATYVGATMLSPDAVDWSGLLVSGLP